MQRHANWCPCRTCAPTSEELSTRDHPKNCRCAYCISNADLHAEVLLKIAELDRKP